MASEEEASKYARLAAVGRTFTPGAPVERIDLFAGRLEQIVDVINAVGQRGQHVVLYGERGVGKTSLANVLSEIFVDRDLPYLHSVGINCATMDNFRSLWMTVFSELHLTPETGEWEDFTPETVRQTLQGLPQRTLIVLDEIDRIENDEALTQLADTVKTLSDHSTDVTLVLVGVADSVVQLIGDHQSIERPLTQVPMRRMNQSELVEIVDRGLGKLDLSIEADPRTRIARLSEGLPHYTHLLSLHAAQRAITDDRSVIQGSDVDSAIDMAVEKAQHSIRAAYQTAVRSAYANALFERVLLACALAPKDELGCFVSGAVREPLSAITGRPYDIPAFAKHLKEFTDDPRGSVLQKIGMERKWFYRFANPLLQPFVVLRGISKGLITEQAVAALQSSSQHPTSAPIDPTGSGLLF